MDSWNITPPSGVLFQKGRTIVYARFATADATRHTIPAADIAQYLDQSGAFKSERARAAAIAEIGEVGNKVSRAKAAIALHRAGRGPAFSFEFDFPDYQPKKALALAAPGEKLFGAILDDYERDIGFRADGTFVKTRTTKTTADNYQQHIRNWIRPYWGEQPASAITVEGIEAWLRLIREGKVRALFARKGAGIVAKSTVEQILTPFIGAAKLAKASFPHGNPVQNIDLKSIWPARSLDEDEQDAEDKNVDAFSLVEQAKILEAAAGTAWVPLLKWWWLEGPRTGEIFGLLSDKIDLANDQVHIHRQHVEGVSTQRMKTKASRRSLPLPVGSEARAILEAQIVIAREASMLHGDRDENGAFPIWRNVFSGKVVLHPVKWIEGPWRTLLAKAGVKYRSSYQNRHTFATMAFAAGQLDLRTISKMLGHKNTAITQAVYIKAAKDDTTKHGYTIRGDAAAAFSHQVAPAASVESIAA